MTLDVTIGQLAIIKENNRAMLWVSACPSETVAICDIEYTLWPNEAYRSGSSEFRQFFREELGQMYNAMREHPDTNDIDIAYIEPFIERINDLPDECEDDANIDRMKWFKFWCNRAVELYGEDASIMFS